MSNQLEPGCLAMVIKSIEGASVGKVVQCIKTLGEHSLYGTIWEIRSRDILVTEFGGVGNTANAPASWLRKINPGELDKDTTKNKELEKTNE